MSSDVNRRTNGKLNPAAGQTVRIMVQVTDTPFVPTGHDQITASFLYNGFFASAAPPHLSSEGEGRITVIGACCNGVLVIAVTMPQLER